MLFVLTLDRFRAIRSGNDQFGRVAKEIPLSKLTEGARDWIASCDSVYDTQDYPGARRKGGEIPAAFDLDAAIAEFEADRESSVFAPGALTAETVNAAIIALEGIERRRLEREQKAFFAAVDAVEDALQSEDLEEFFHWVSIGSLEEFPRQRHQFEISNEVQNLSDTFIPDAVTEQVWNEMQAIKKQAAAQINKNFDALPLQGLMRHVRVGIGSYHRDTRRYSLHGSLDLTGTIEGIKTQEDATNFLRQQIERALSHGRMAELFGEKSGRLAALQLDERARGLFVKHVFEGKEIDALSLVRQINKAISEACQPASKIAKKAIADCEEVVRRHAAHYQAERKEEQRILAAYAARFPEKKVAERLKANVLPLSEQRDIFRQHVFSPLDGYAKFERIAGTELGVRDADLRCSTSPLTELSADEFQALSEVRALMPGANAEVKILSHACESFRDRIARSSVQVELTWHGLTFSRELAVPLKAAA